MIPLRLIIHNFRAIEHADIDLSAVTLAAIAGRNGAGKSSAFTLAPRFALFGDVIKGISLDDLVRRGVQEMSVEFQFEHQGSVFRAIRTRSTKGKGKSTLELQEQVNGQWESRSAEKITDTEAVIRSLLNLDDETFTASSMILQGQANAFTGATAGKRKEILSQILGLNVYEQLQDRARQRAGLLDTEIEKAKDKLLTLDERLAARPAKEEELRIVEIRHEFTQTNVAEDERAVRENESQLAVLEVKRSRILQIDRDTATIDDEIASLQKERSDHQGRLERSEKILANEAGILAKAVELEEVKQQIAALEARQPEVERLRRDLAATETDLKQLADELTRLNDRVLAVTQQLSGRDALQKQAADHEQETVRLREFEEKAERWNLLAAELRTLDTQLDRETFRIETENRALVDKISTLEEQEIHIHDSGCLPTCKFQQAAAAAVAELPELRRRLADLDRSQIAALTLSIAQKQIEQKDIGYDPDAHRACRNRVAELQASATAFAQLAGKDELLQQLEQQCAEKLARQESTTARRDDLQQQTADLEAELAPLSELTTRAADLQRWAKLKDEISAAREATANAKERIAAIDREIAGKNVRKEELENEKNNLIIDTLDYDRLHRDLDQLQAVLQDRRSQLAALAEQIGGIKAVLAALEVDQLERDRLSADLEPKALRWTRYQTLIKAFGRDGIPALIIENAVPQLERIANEILGQMSKGKHYIRFETQRELKSRDGVAETLDIMIGDWTAERPYETFSGGEQLRIDYAIRFALAELLAQRAGSKVEWLTIDEGLGSQDAEHRALVLESIKSVSSRFKRVLVITHIEDAQAAFDQVIRFENADGGVGVQVA
ncbi:AAA family ATPase [Paenibacillus brevis]|uniref:SMC family ATPase n=1 Tax=Paenibacillus brevis TaxID=2841508 RepID=A0ABS6FSJ4_9BACL|nr:SMC family ATPase [Paenibacillus brevis]MBU5673212.1 SMC family ATPase [Paenibacillus brevis]